VIPEAVERRARWVLDALGAREIGFGDDFPYCEAWNRSSAANGHVATNSRKRFSNLSRLEELAGKGDARGRFTTPNAILLPPPLDRGSPGDLSCHDPSLEAGLLALRRLRPGQRSESCGPAGQVDERERDA
jgi:hypothetical protein